DDPRAQESDRARDFVEATASGGLGGGMRLIGGRRVIKATSVVAAAVLITGAGNSLAARAATTSGSRPTSPNHPATKQTQTPKVEATAPGHGGVDVSWHHSPKNARAFTVSR